MQSGTQVLPGCSQHIPLGSWQRVCRCTCRAVFKGWGPQPSVLAGAQLCWLPDPTLQPEGLKPTPLGRPIPWLQLRPWAGCSGEPWRRGLPAGPPDGFVGTLFPGSLFLPGSRSVCFLEPGRHIGGVSSLVGLGLRLQWDLGLDGPVSLTQSPGRAKATQVNESARLLLLPG